MIIIEKLTGYTINQFIEKYKKDNNIKKLCFCGRLDPMARGKVLLLIDEECKIMPKYLSLDKTYQFEICFGIQTDTDDFLGIIENISETNLFEEFKDDLIKYISLFENNNYNQKFHKYSSKKVNGKTIRNQDLDVIPTHKVKIYKSNILGFNKYEYNSFINSIIDNINTIDKNKDFRQSEIINQWKNIKRGYIYSLKVELKVSSGFYVRQFVRDLSNAFEYPMVVYDINRIDLSIE